MTIDFIIKLLAEAGLWFSITWYLLNTFFKKGRGFVKSKYPVRVAFTGSDGRFEFSDVITDESLVETFKSKPVIVTFDKLGICTMYFNEKI